ncbi:unnamed protein product [Dimorphilus gyrociliatus]|uniref:RING-type domain-containing protein n=1 Tax=Dimorphilus gyrociliatus TaxID=2664684 RepID=A0A7I8VVL9_9ANNE|nr:unnamed protein product [Dimorphilus gyrociliatus]
MSLKEYIVRMREDLIVCKLCNNLWIDRDPRILNCSHIFCYDCLKDLLEERNTEENFNCYSCGKSIDMPKEGGIDELNCFEIIKSIDSTDNSQLSDDMNVQEAGEKKFAVMNEIKLMENVIESTNKDENTNLNNLRNHVRGVEKMFEKQVEDLSFELKFQYRRHRRLIRLYIRTYNWFINVPDKNLLYNKSIIKRIKELRQNALSMKIDLKLNDNYLESIGRIEVSNTGSFTNFLIKKRHRIIGAPYEIADIAIGMNELYIICLYSNTETDVWKILCYSLDGDYLNSCIEIEEFTEKSDRKSKRNWIVSRCKSAISYDCSSLYLSAFYPNEIHKLQLFGRREKMKRFCKINAQYICSVLEGLLIVESASSRILLYSDRGEKLKTFPNRHDILSICSLRLPTLVTFVNTSNELIIMNTNNRNKKSKVNCQCQITNSMVLKSLSSSIAVMNKDRKSIFELYYNGTAFRDIIVFQETPICMTSSFRENKDFLYVITKNTSGLLCLNIYKSVVKV